MSWTSRSVGRREHGQVANEVLANRLPFLTADNASNNSSMAKVLHDLLDKQDPVAGSDGEEYREMEKQNSRVILAW